MPPSHTTATENTPHQRTFHHASSLFQFSYTQPHTRRCPDYSLTPMGVSPCLLSLSSLLQTSKTSHIPQVTAFISALSGRLTNIPHHDHFFLPQADHHLSFSGYSFSEPLLMVMAPLGILISSPRPHHFLNCKPQDATKLHLFT